jgi:hypothetical protein
MLFDKIVVMEALRRLELLSPPQLARIHSLKAATSPWVGHSGETRQDRPGVPVARRIRCKPISAFNIPVRRFP